MPFCVNCDNRHGCKTATPVCLSMEREPDETALRGRELMVKRSALSLCRRCKDFAICWPRAEYDAAVAKEP